MFPIKITYRFRPNTTCSDDQIIDHIKTEWERLKVDAFEEQEQQKGTLIFKNKFFNDQGRNHIFSFIDGGTISSQNKHVRIVFSSVRTVLFALFASIFFSVISRHIFVGIGAFLWLYGMNVILFLTRARGLVKRLKKEIEQLSKEK